MKSFARSLTLLSIVTEIADKLLRNSTAALEVFVSMKNAEESDFTFSFYYSFKNLSQLLFFLYLKSLL